MPSPEEWSLPLMGLVAGRYRYLADLLYLESCTAAIMPYSWPRGPSPLSVEVFARHLRSYPDKQFVSYILRGLSSGFRIGFSHSSHRLRTRGRNHPSSLANATVVSDQSSRQVTLLANWHRQQLLKSMWAQLVWCRKVMTLDGGGW